MKNLMIDIETLDTTPTAKIISIGAVFFELATGKTGKEFYQPVDRFGMSQRCRTESSSTIEWWDQQSPEARKVFTDENRVDLCEALPRLTKFINQNCNSFTVNIWAQGPQFDCVILEDAYSNEFSETPWKFWNVRDCRTVIELGSEYANVKRQKGNHSSIEDCHIQIKNLVAALKGLGK